MADYRPMCVAVIDVILQGETEGGNHVLTKQPKEASWELNSYRQADSFSLTFDASEWGFHPDDIASMGVELYAFNKREGSDDLAPYLIPENLLVMGRCDTASFEASDDGRWFSCEGQDYTTRLIARKWDPSKKVPVGDRLDRTVQGLIDAVLGDQRGMLKTVVELADANYRGWGYPVVRGHGAEAKGLSFPEGKTYWDVITELCARSGKRVFVRHLSVVISTPQDLYALADGAAPFDDGTVTSDFDRSTPARRVAYGRNLSSLKISRRMNGEKTPQQIVRCWSAAQQKTLQGAWPLDAADATKSKRKERTSKTGKISVSGTEEAQVSIVHGIWDEAELTRMAETRYHERSRGETEIEYETRDLTDLDGLAMLTHRAGDPAWIEYDPIGKDTMKNLSAYEREQALVRSGFERRVASEVAKNYDALARWSRPYYVRNVSGKYSVDDGVTLTTQAINYVKHITGARPYGQVAASGAAFADDGTVL